jgi:hypothetical protein
LDAWVLTVFAEGVVHLSDNAGSFNRVLPADIRNSSLGGAEDLSRFGSVQDALPDEQIDQAKSDGAPSAPDSSCVTHDTLQMPMK